MLKMKLEQTPTRLNEPSQKTKRSGKQYWMWTSRSHVGFGVGVLRVARLIERRAFPPPETGVHAQELSGTGPP